MPQLRALPHAGGECGRGRVAECEFKLGECGLIVVEVVLMFQLVLHFLDDLPLIVEIVLLARNDRVP